MDRRQFIQTTGLTVLGTALTGMSSPLFGLQAGAARTEYKAVRGGVGIFTGQGGTIGIFSNADGTVVIDSQFPKTAKICLAEIQKKSERPIDVLFNTHHHGDHTQGNSVFRAAAKKIVAHKNVPGYQKKQGKERNFETVTVPDTTFEQSWKIKLGEETLRAQHFGPAHTGGDAVITAEKANVAHLGDLVFNGRHPFIDPPAGASMRNWPKVLEAIVKAHDKETTYIFGHSRPGLPVTGKAKDVFRFRDYLNAVNAYVRSGLEAGKSKEEIASLEKLKGFEKYVAAGSRLSLRRSLECSFDEQSKTQRKKS